MVDVSRVAHDRDRARRAARGSRFRAFHGLRFFIRHMVVADEMEKSMHREMRQMMRERLCARRALPALWSRRRSRCRRAGERPCSLLAAARPARERTARWSACRSRANSRLSVADRRIIGQDDSKLASRPLTPPTAAVGDRAAQCLGVGRISVPDATMTSIAGRPPLRRLLSRAGRPVRLRARGSFLDLALCAPAAAPRVVGLDDARRPARAG